MSIMMSRLYLIGLVWCCLGLLAAMLTELCYCYYWQKQSEEADAACWANSQGHMEQLCSNMGDTKDLVKCQHNWNGWQEVRGCFRSIEWVILHWCDLEVEVDVCACEEDFCNTFAYLRGSIEEESTDNAADSQPPNLNEEESSIASLGRRRGSSLVILLVIIPLSVGALAVCLIFINYHCKMC
ncbi:hypothetical protein DINM_021596 [Dirofilaria immitis]|nr:hypothetical protein [Dirofilaria immitis]